MRVTAAVIAIVVTVMAAFNVSGQNRHDIDSLRHVIDSRSSDPIEGIWQLTDDGATIAITATAGHTGSYDIVLVDATDMSVAPMTACGSLRRTAGDGVYDAHLRLNPGAGVKSRYKDFMLTLTSAGRFTLSAYNRTSKLNLRRMLPYLFRTSVTVERSNRPSGVDGAVRIYPKGSAGQPIIL
jgi:hypothetical protein